MKIKISGKLLIFSSVSPRFRIHGKYIINKLSNQYFIWIFILFIKKHNEIKICLATFCKAYKYLSHTEKQFRIAGIRPVIAGGKAFRFVNHIPEPVHKGDNAFFESVGLVNHVR